MTYALITGASKGIGLSMAHQLAARKYNLLLIARSEEELSAAAASLTAKWQVKVFWLAIDLSKPEAAATIADWCKEGQYPISVLINNAGYAVWGNFTDRPLTEHQQMIQVNAEAPVALCHYLLPVLRQQKQAYILNVASTAAYQAVATLSLYAATKSFMLLFSRGLRQELKDSNVSVSCLCPGPVKTNFIDRAGMQAIKETADKYGMMPDDVAETAIKGMFNRKAEMIPGMTNAATALLTRIVPKSIVEKIAAGLYKK
ncbi:SDR family NAD(P)-dependent oxidoreductase [Chitinophaga rhizophila]|uniref:SDR family oxidoreductase n=1 Tax=Chitinophaga rhizophila TaxID=2866212 RepID=A0ABS7GJE4_9BACT|nr:SDR family oxidoreductase [Chitinophaga rhizophila]MBW8687813.1 SDR family oxidoreductase [Chitinophaga rhizophila]